MKDAFGIQGTLRVVKRDADGNIVYDHTTKNMLTLTGASFYVGRAQLASGQPAAITGMKLGTGTTTPSAIGAGAALDTYLADSHQALDSAPSVNANEVTMVATWAAGKATSANPITEVVLVNDTLTDATSPTGNTIARALLSPAVSVKTAGEALEITWTQTATGA